MQKGGEKNNISKTMIVHVCAVFVFLCLCGLFFILGGGENANIVEEQKNNIDTIPDIMVEDDATNKLEAYRKAEALIEKERKERELQSEHNSFDFFSKQLESPETDLQTQTEELNEEISKSNENIEDLRELAQATPQKPRPQSPGSSNSKPRTKKEEVSYEDAMNAEKQKKHQEIEGIFKSTTDEKPEQKNPFKPINQNNSNRNKGTDIKAVIHGEQKNITSSSLVRIRTQQEMVVNGTTIPKNTIITGKANINKNRVEIVIDNIVYNDNTYPFKGEIYDINGSRGLYIPDNGINDGMQDATDNTLSQTDVSIKGSGIGVGGLVNTSVNSVSNAIKQVVRNKNKEVKVTLSANYRILIKMNE